MAAIVQTTPYDKQILELRHGLQPLSVPRPESDYSGEANRNHLRDLDNKREGYLAAVEAHADLLAVAVDLMAYLEEMAPSMRQGSADLFSQRTPQALRDRLRAGLTKATQAR